MIQKIKSHLQFFQAGQKYIMLSSRAQWMPKNVDSRPNLFQSNDRISIYIYLNSLEFLEHVQRHTLYHKIQVAPLINWPTKLTSSSKLHGRIVSRLLSHSNRARGLLFFKITRIGKKVMFTLLAIIMELIISNKWINFKNFWSALSRDDNPMTSIFIWK